MYKNQQAVLVIVQVLYTLSTAWRAFSLCNFNIVEKLHFWIHLLLLLFHIEVFQFVFKHQSTKYIFEWFTLCHLRSYHFTKFNTSLFKNKYNWYSLRWLCKKNTIKYILKLHTKLALSNICEYRSLLFWPMLLIIHLIIKYIQKHK